MVQEPINKPVVCVVGLGYVGYPLAEAFSRHIRTIGFDIDSNKIKLIKKSGSKISVTSDSSKIKEADYIIICVPTPVTKTKQPDLTPICSAAEIVGKNMKKGATVILESTVYPGVTEEIVKPILEKESGFPCGSGFRIGYSPERINPGDELHVLSKITKIVAGMDQKTGEDLASLYGLITKIYQAKSIQTAEAAKVIENIQRDLNIALMNELSVIFHRLGLDTTEVLEAAGTKWNFLPFVPGLVGGHCIPVDPYYLVARAEESGYHPQVILAGRAINDSMPGYVAGLAIKGLNEVGKVIKNSKILIMGLTYKENVPDIRESPVQGIIKELNEYNIDIYGYDPLISIEEISKFGIKPVTDLDSFNADCLIITVAHTEFRQLSVSYLEKLCPFERPVIIDVKGILKTTPGKAIYKRL